MLKLTLRCLINALNVFSLLTNVSQIEPNNRFLFNLNYAIAIYFILVLYVNNCVSFVHFYFFFSRTLTESISLSL